MRICSLLPSATEIVAELGLVESLVGISQECDWPPEVRGLPVVTASRVETTRLTSLRRNKNVGPGPTANELRSPARSGNRARASTSKPAQPPARPTEPAF
jgi:hypothetical protein